MKQFIEYKHRFFARDTWKLCNWCGHPEEYFLHIDIPDGFEPIATAPRNGRHIEVINKDGEITEVHFAENLSGEEQPPFSGFFKPVYKANGQVSFYHQVVGSIGWRAVIKKRQFEENKL